MGINEYLEANEVPGLPRVLGEMETHLSRENDYSLYIKLFL